MEMKKIIAVVFGFLVVPAVLAMGIPVVDEAEDNAVAPAHSPVMTDNWQLELPYWIKSGNPILKAVLKVRHDFNGYFSAWLSPAQAELLRLMGIETEPVQLYYISVPDHISVPGKPVCGDGEAHPSEECGEPGLPECPEGSVCIDCKCVAEEEEEAVACYPDNQYPWGILKVRGGAGGAGVDVAVLDTGVMTDHPDLARRVADCKDFTKGPKVKSGCADGNGHGTHVAGTILADGGPGGLGIFGVAPQARLLAYKVCSDAGLCWTDDIAAAIDYAAANGAEIISMSLGGDIQSGYIRDAIDRNPGVLYVAAAGNDRRDGVGSIDYPGAYVKVVAVAAFDSLDAMASFSSLGVNDGDWAIEEKEIEFAAPGVGVESTWNDGCYKYLSGTSMSTPHVSGIAARDWKGTAADTRTYLQELAYNYTTQVFDYGQTGDDIEAGFGLPVPA
jgi:subtilisin